VSNDLGTLLIIGAGPKAAAVCAKCRILKDLGQPFLTPIVFERHEPGAAWSGEHGYTTGRLPLGTSPEKDVGFPYFKDALCPEVTLELFRHYSWPAYQIEEQKGYSEWLDRGRPPPLHSEWAKYISWVLKKATRGFGQVVTGEVAEIFSKTTTSNKPRWEIKVRGNSKRFQGDGLLITGTGEAKRLDCALPNNDNIMYGDNFWTPNNLAKIEHLRVNKTAGGNIVIVGGGESASAIAAYIAEQLQSKENVNIIVLTSGGAIFSRGEGYYENRVFSQPQFWLALEEEQRLDIIRRADRGVFSPGVLARLAEAPNVDHKNFRVVDVTASPTGELRVSNDHRVSIECRVLVFAMGFDPMSFSRMIRTRQLRDALRKRIDNPKIYRVEREILPDLSVPESISPAKLYLPMVAGLKQGPGFPNLSCLGILSDRLLERRTYPKSLWEEP